MKIIYHCFGGTHSSVTAACIHLGLLPRDRLPKYDELIRITLFDRRDVSTIGKIVFMGKDDLGNEVYVVGRQSRPKLLYNVTEGLVRLFDIDPGSLMLVDVFSFVNSSMRAGGFMSRRMGLVGLGRPIVTWGTLKNYKSIVAVVEKVYSELTHGQDRRAGETMRIMHPEAAC